MGLSADLIVLQVINTLLEKGKPQKLLKHIHGELTGREKYGRKRCYSNKNDHSHKIGKLNRFKTLGKLHKEWC